MLILLNIAFAENIDVIKEYSSQAKINEIMEIKIHIYNPESSSKEFRIIENLPQNTEAVEPLDTLTKKYDGLEVKYYNWRTTVSPGSVKTITYKIKILSLGVKVINPTEIVDLSSGESYFSNPITFNIKCIPDDVCGEGENSATCPEDCATGIDDGICDYILDGLCDPDCEEEPDCKGGFNYIFLVYIFGIIVILLMLVIILPKFFI